jgi:hypothetical protein
LIDAARIVVCAGLVIHRAIAKSRQLIMAAGIFVIYQAKACAA